MRKYLIPYLLLWSLSLKALLETTLVLLYIKENLLCRSSRRPSSVLQSTNMQKKSVLPLDLKGLENTLKQLAFEKYDEFIRCFNIIEERLRQMEVFSGLYGTRDTFYLCGWMREKS